MSTEAIRKKFESWLASNGFTQSDLSKINGEYIIPSVQLAWLSRQQAVKDMDINIQPIITAINMLERDGTAVRDEISDELRELVGKIKEFQS